MTDKHYKVDQIEFKISQAVKYWTLQEYLIKQQYTAGGQALSGYHIAGMVSHWKSPSGYLY